MKVGFYNIQGGTGKTTIAANFAYILSQSVKTILIDCDLYGGTISLVFGLEDIDHNLNTYLAGNSAIEDIIYNYEDLAIIPTGVTSDVFGYKTDIEKFIKLVEVLAEEYDVIVYDFPPNIPEGSLLLAYGSEENLVNKVIVVGEDSIPSIVNSLKTIDLLKDFGIGLTGILINKYRGLTDLSEISDDIIGVLSYDPNVERQWSESMPITKIKTKFSKELINITHDIANIYLEKDLASLRALKVVKTLSGITTEEELRKNEEL
ncbi:Septum site-determining protein MinD [Methanocaldococcus lauensis]|uniref:Septum site-determining protein MinD n=1 Tax=Methanocaldococcus lauensis TaxID=2546128 RepID=A0A8D6SVH1_9EURY|nr:MinD/ParA family protein [Methanocaldococcus lauensis]CAB3287351.1 Septum site-determining protein MinD [Methanocaldococcus lauensis]CAB3288396.1 Septum site-determining protein MinD [Methanocaldococcus lauensis]